MISWPNSPNLGLIWPLEAGHVPKNGQNGKIGHFWAVFGVFRRLPGGFQRSNPLTYYSYDPPDPTQVKKRGHVAGMYLGWGFARGKLG